MTRAVSRLPLVAATSTSPVQLRARVTVGSFVVLVRVDTEALNKYGEEVAKLGEDWSRAVMYVREYVKKYRIGHQADD